jgi:copper homeostasis protein
MTVTVEICVEGLPSALAAGAGGADRVELCENLAIGGVTPSAGAIAVACRELAIPVRVLIRPRAGDFAYTPSEFEAMRHDVATARALGASGVVLGLLTPDGRVDRERTARLVEAAHPLGVTFHRAFDLARDPFEALDDLIALGCDRVLTSGFAPTAREGLDRLLALAQAARGRIAILPGGSVAEDDLPALLTPPITEVHIGSAARSGHTTDPDKVRRLVDVAREIARQSGPA